jgi:hypothetical protein
MSEVTMSEVVKPKRTRRQPVFGVERPRQACARGWRPRFLATFALSGVLTRAAAAAGVDERTVRRAIKRDAAFAQDVEQARPGVVRRFQVTCARCNGPKLSRRSDGLCTGCRSGLAAA